MRRIILTIATALIGALLLGMAACGRRGDKAPEQGAVLHSSQATTIQDALSELDALEKPEGVDAKLWDELKGALKKALECRAETNDGGAAVPAVMRGAKVDGRDARPTDKITSTPPTGDINKVNDFAISDHGDGSYTLSWHYRNLGDYDQNGVVGVSDITPLAMHFGKTYNYELEANTIQAVADGSLNGTVGIEDVTQIAMYFGTECAGYSLRTSPDPPASVEETTELGFLPLDLAQGEGRIAYGADHPLPSHTYIAVVPVDADGVLGELSNVVLSPNHSPGAMLTVDPAEGDAPLTVGLDAGESSDMDGPIAKYEWDWEGDGVWDYDSGTLSYVEHVYETPDFYYPVVRVTDAEGASDTAEAAVFAGQWRITTVAESPALSCQLTVVNGRPAIIFNVGNAIMYVRAANEMGTAWGAPQLLAPQSSSSSICSSLAVVSGRPTIAYYSDSGYLRYIRAEDANGDAWGSPQTIPVDAIGSDFSDDLSLAVINGYPAVIFDGPGLDETPAINFTRALDANGDAWGSPVVVSDVDINSFCKMAEINGRAAVCYWNHANGYLTYRTAVDAAGDTWGSPAMIENIPEIWEERTLAEIDGHPAVCYVGYEGDTLCIKYRRALEPGGSAWGSPLTLDSLSDYGAEPSLAIINGNPAVAYVKGPTGNFAPMLALAADPNGAGWRSPVVVQPMLSEQETTGHTSLAEVNGHPAIGYAWSESADGKCELRYAIYY